MKSNIVLIGMPGAGKSTVGLLLAKKLGKNFVDTDILLQIREGKTLQQLMDEKGYLYLRDCEASALQAIDGHNLVVATGGSAVYSKTGISHLQQNGIIVYLETPLQTLRQRIHDYETRGIARRPEQSFAALYAERDTLYREYADATIHCADASTEQVVSMVCSAVTGLSRAPR